MKWLKYISVLFFGFGMVSLQAQVMKGEKVSIQLNNANSSNVERATDIMGPTISIMTPQMENGIFYESTDQEIVIVGKVTDEKGVNIFSINSEMVVCNSEGGFVYSLDLERGQNSLKLVAVDRDNNISEKELIISYTAPEPTLADKIVESSVYYALVIGINSYEDYELNDLVQPIKDCELFIEAITTNYIFEEENITFLKNATRDDIITSLDVLANEVSPYDNLLIFYAGHGEWDEKTDNGYWLPSDAKKSVKTDWVRNSTIVDYLLEIDSKHTLLITDACFGGAILNTRSGFTKDDDEGFDLLYDLPSRKAMTSGNKTVVPDRSAFAKYLVQRLNSNQNKYLTSTSLFSSFQIAASSNSNAVPQYGIIPNTGHQGGEFIFLKRD